LSRDGYAICIWATIAVLFILGACAEKARRSWRRGGGLQVSSETLALSGIVAVFLLGCGCVWVGGSFMEAKTYTELTGKRVTCWQAMWVDLRVIEPARTGASE